MNDVLTEPETFIKGMQNLQASETNPFPCDVFPEPIQDIIYATNESLKFPIDYVGASILYAASVAIGNTCKSNKLWIENCVLFMALIGRAGITKSHPLEFVLNPINKKDDISFLEYENKLKEYEKAISLSKNERESQGIDEPEKPILNKYLVSDTTPEALYSVHSFNKRGLGVYVDEMSGWFKNFNRYNSSGEQEQWNSIWSGKSINIDRKNGNSIRISKPFISVCGTIQTSIIDDMAKNNRGLNGFTDRFLFVMPEGLKKEAWSNKKLDPIYSNNWENIITKLLDIKPNIDNEGNPTPNILDFSNEANEILMEWQSNNTNLCNETEDQMLAGIYSKFDIHILRISLILQLLQYACGEDISEINIKAIQGAIKLTEYFKTTAKNVYDIISNSSPLDKLPSNKKQFYEALPEVVKTGEAIELAIQFNIRSRTVNNFIKNKTFFYKIDYGKYEKVL